MAKNPNDNRVFVGLWLNESSKGTKYMFGKQEDTTPEVKWLIFKDAKFPEVRQLCRTVGDGGMENVTNLQLREGPHGTFHSNGDYLFTENQFYKEGTRQPTHTLIIGRKDGQSSTGS